MLLVITAEWADEVSGVGGALGYCDTAIPGVVSGALLSLLKGGLVQK